MYTATPYNKTETIKTFGSNLKDFHSIVGVEVLSTPNKYNTATNKMVTTIK